jgi:hypothetical protein
VAAVIVTSEFTLFATAVLVPIVPTKFDVLPAGKGFKTFATTTVAVANTVDPEKMLLSVI